MAKRREGNCLCCGDKFTLDVRNRGRQKYCSKQSCRAAGKAARQRRWLAKPQNRNYFREADNAARVREWQRKNPGYWRNTARNRRRTLQDALPVQVHESHEETSSLALQDALRLQGPVLIGLIAHLSGSTLQDDIAGTARGLLQLGQDILARKVRDGGQKGAQAGAAAAGADAVQLDRSTAGARPAR
jgi:hypothetical protein